MSYKGLWLLLALAVTLAAVLLVKPDRADAQDNDCSTNGIVPGSVSVISTNNGAGQVSAHVVRFQLCGGIRGPRVTDVDGNIIGPPDKIGLLWQGFTLDNGTSARVNLSISNGSRWWPATTELARDDYRGLAVEFTSEQLDWLAEASRNSPLALQFFIPLSAGMVNPKDLGRYQWDVSLYRVLPGYSCYVNPGDFSSTIVPAYIPGGIQIFPKAGGPGTKVTVIGHGFKPLAPVQSVTIGSVDIMPRHRVFTDASGDFTLETLFPGLDVGIQPVLVQLDGMTLGAEFRVEYWGYGEVARVEEEFAILGDNFVAVFHLDESTNCWAFYDPEIYAQSDLRYLITGERYWILVRNPAEVILNRIARNLTCTSEGDCWNQIIW